MSADLFAGVEELIGCYILFFGGIILAVGIIIGCAIGFAVG